MDDGRSEEVDRYLAGVEPGKRAALEALRATIRSLLPGAEEGISYGLPAFRWQGRPVAGFAAAKRHCSYFPMSGGVVAALQEDLAGYETSKGAIRFDADRALPEELVRKLLSARISEIEAAARPKRGDT